VLYQASEYSVPCSCMIQSLLTFISLYDVTFLKGYDIPTNLAWLQQDNARPRTSNATLLTSLWFSRAESCQTSILHYLRSDFHSHQSQGLKTLQLFSVVVLERQDVSEKSAHNPRTENCHPNRQ
jgi:hypothetical protein